MGGFDDIEELNGLGEEFGSIFQESMEAMERYQSGISKKQRQRIESDYAAQMENLEEIMESMTEMFTDMEESLSDADKLMYQTLLANRQRDMKRLERDYRRRHRQMQNDQRDFFDDVNDGFDSVLDNLGRLAQISTMMDVGGIKDALTDTAESNLEMRRNLKAYQGMTDAEYKKFTENLNKFTREMNNQYGNVFSATEVTQNAYTLATELGIQGEEFLLSMSKGLSMFEKATNIEGTDSYSALYKIADNWRESADSLISQYNDLAVMGNRLGYETGPQDFIENITAMADAIAMTSDTAEAAKNQMSDVAKVTTMLEDSFMDSKTWFSMLKEIQEASPDALADLSEKYAWTGQSVSALQNRLNQGDYTGVTEDILDGLASRINSDNPMYQNMIRDALGLDSSDYRQLQQRLRESPRYFHEMSDELDAAYGSALSGASQMEEALGDIHVSIIDRVKNAITSSEIGQTVTDLIDDLDISIVDLYAGVQLLKGASGMLKTLAKPFTSGLTKILGSAGMEMTGGMWQATGSGLLAKIIGSTGTSMISGSGILGGLSSVGSALGGGSIASTGAGLAAAGAASIAGGALGAAGLVSAAKDVWDSTQATKWQEKEVKQKSAATKAGLVAAGAAIGSVVPGVGTLIGAGVGGLLALIGGDKVAQAFQDWADGTSRINKAMDKLTEAQEEVAKTMSRTKEFEELESLYKQQRSILDTLNPESSEYKQMLSEIKGTIDRLNEVVPNYVQVEDDGITIKEESLAATEKLIEAEKSLAQIRAQSAVKEAVNVEKDLANQLDKSLEVVASNEGKNSDVTRLNELFQTLRQYEDQFYKDVEVVDPRSGQTYNVKQFDYSGLTGEAKDAYDAWLAEARSLYKNAGLDTAFDNVDWTMSDASYVQGVYNNLRNGNDLDDIQRILESDQEARADADAKQAAYDKAYQEAVRTLETSIGGSFSDVASNYSNMSASDQTFFRNALSDLEELNDTYSRVSKDIRVSTDGIASLAGIDGSHKGGLWEVPKDGYRAILHKGEAVLTKEDADDWRSNVKRKRSVDEIEALKAGGDLSSGRSFTDLWSFVSDGISGVFKGVTDTLFGGKKSNGYTVSGLDNNDEEGSIWRALLAMGYTKAGAAGIMGNFEAESGNQAANLENSRSRQLGLSDAEYAALVDQNHRWPEEGTNLWGKTGYGLGQWTYPTRKKKMMEFLKDSGKSVAALDFQLEWFSKEMGEDFSKLNKFLKQTDDVAGAADYFLKDFERPGAGFATSAPPRRENAKRFYQKYAHMDAGDVTATPVNGAYAVNLGTTVDYSAGSGSFTPRKTRPEQGNKYYITKGAGGYSDAIKGSPIDAWNDVLANCVGYAYGRFNEIVGEGAMKYLRPVNAGKFMDYKGSLATGLDPQVGAMMVWKKNGGAGHVAVVEEVHGKDRVTTSESGYGASKPFWNQDRTRGNGNWGYGGPFQGFIYNPAVGSPTSESSLEQLADAYGLAKYEQGTRYVPETQLALLHEGEEVIPAKIAEERRKVPSASEVSPSSSVAVKDNSDILQLMKWGFEYLGKKIESSQPVVMQSEDTEPKRKDSRTERAFRLGVL